MSTRGSSFETFFCSISHFLCVFNELSEKVKIEVFQGLLFNTDFLKKAHF